MPKINVYPVPHSDGTDADTRVEVGWHPNGEVQIGAAIRQPITVTTGAVEATTGVPAAPPATDEHGAWTGQYVDLDRHGINQLIRALREARDKAFGRDE